MNDFVSSIFGSAENMWRWLGQAAGFTLIAIVVMWLARRFGSIAITQIIRRTVRNNRFTHVAMSPEDIRKRQDTLISLSTAIWKALVWIVGILVIMLNIFPGVRLEPIFASAGIIGIALGFGAQSLIKDFITGIFIITENQYRVGDVVDIEGASGTVEKISIRSTTLRDTDGNVHYLTNGNIIHVINKTMGYSKVNLTINVEADTDIDILAELINQVGEEMAETSPWKERLLEPPRFLNIGAFTDTSLEVKITAKTQPSQQWSVTGELRKRLLRAFHGKDLQLTHTGSEPITISAIGKKPKPKA
ncbi:MAG TPA: mechanosensitive ion channel family protein [Candidatus Saccharimonadales bacterium]